MISHKGKNYFITRITSVIGKTCTDFLLDQGANIFSIIRDSDYTPHERTKIEILDLHQVEHIEIILSKLVEGIKLDGILLCAGIEETVPFRQSTIEIVLEIFKVNFFPILKFFESYTAKSF
jgi:short-subunit dehydrogenase